MKKGAKEGIEYELRVNKRDKTGEYIKAADYFKSAEERRDWWRRKEEESLVEFYGGGVKTELKKGVSDEF